MSKKNLLSDITQSMKRDTLARAQAATQEQPQDKETLVTSEPDQLRNVEDSNIKTFEYDNVRTFENSNTKQKKRGNKDGWARAVVTIEPKYYKKIKKYCLENDTTFQGFIESLLVEHFGKLNKSTKNPKGV